MTLSVEQVEHYLRHGEYPNGWTGFEFRKAISALALLALREQQPVNQCDGCRRGLDLLNGLHRLAGQPVMACTKYLYAAAPAEAKDALLREAMQAMYFALVGSNGLTDNEWKTADGVFMPEFPASWSKSIDLMNKALSSIQNHLGEFARDSIAASGAGK